MVDVKDSKLLSDIRDQITSRGFLASRLEEFESAVRAVSEDIFLSNVGGREIRNFDSIIADNLPDYEFEHEGERGRNPKCKLWSKDGFDHRVDLYHE